MKILQLAAASLPLLLVSAAPQQLVLKHDSPLDGVRHWIGKEADSLAQLAKELADVPAQVLKHATSDPAFELVALDRHPDHSLRVKETEGLCDPNVKQHSGYLDISDSRHLFFWFFESRSSPSEDPLVLWLNGGPGCSSSTGLLFELGPCNVREGGNGTEVNPYAWNEKANVIFLDQPVAVGFSYADDGSTINNSKDVGVDVYAFLQLFYSRFPKYAKVPFHIAGESYGGHYVPSIGSHINEMNKQLKPQTTPKSHYIPLESIMIGNGLTEPLTQFAAFPDFSCKPSDTAIFDEQTCSTMRSKSPTCSKLIKFCYDNPSRFTCLPANVYCTQNMEGPIQNVKVNPYNVRLPCDRDGEDGPLCYREMSWIDTYLNRPEVKKAVGAPPELEFVGCNMKVTQAFFLNGDHMHNSAQLLVPMVEDGIKVLIYAGDLDWICNYLGNKRWFLNLETPFKEEVNAQKDHKWRTLDSNKVAGEVRVGGGGNWTFARIYDAGHMVPHDQPEASLDMFARWIQGVPFN